MLESPYTPSSVRTVHILSNGEMVYTREEYEKIKDRFNWVDQHFILAEILRLRRLTDNGKQSIIAIYEESKVIKNFLNLEFDFHPSDLLINT